MCSWDPESQPSYNKGTMDTSSVSSPQRQLDLTQPFILAAGETVELLRGKVRRDWEE